MGASDYVHLDVRKVQKVTEKAMLLKLASGESVWIPLSQISDAEDYEEGDEDCTISVTRWIADQKWLDAD